MAQTALQIDQKVELLERAVGAILDHLITTLESGFSSEGFENLKTLRKELGGVNTSDPVN